LEEKNKEMEKIKVGKKEAEEFLETYKEELENEKKKFYEMDEFYQN
jgi:hypothetical protein